MRVILYMLLARTAPHATECITLSPIREAVTPAHRITSHVISLSVEATESSSVPSWKAGIAWLSVAMCWS